MESLIKRITVDADVCHGKPTIRNMRYPVEMIIELLSSGMSWKEITADYPAIVEDDIRACLLFASQLARVKTIHRVLV
jgi:uncharacterized protein (DUF433 family)